MNPPPPRDFTVSKTGPRTAYVAWLPPTFPYGILVSYNLTFTAISSADSSSRSIILRASFQTYNLTGLNVGNSYRFSIAVNNNVGTSEMVDFPDTLVFPETAPPATDHRITSSNAVSPTGRSVTISLSNEMFSQEYGPILEYAVLVAELAYGADNTGTITDAIPPERTWASVQGLSRWLPYRASREGYNPFINVSNRKRRQATATFIDYAVGSDRSCDPTTENVYCNGPLKTYSTYAFAVRAYGADGTYTDTLWSDPISTGFDVMWFIYPLIALIIITLLILIVFCCVWRGCCGNPSRNSMYEDKTALVQVVQPEEPVPAQAKENPYEMTTVMQSTTSRPIAVNRFAQHVARLSANNNKLFSQEYASLQSKGASESRKVSKYPENMAKNRYRNILPNDNHRVQLQNSMDGSDYINASFLSGRNKDNEYIATQGPLPNTVSDFWQMVWEQQTAAIVMVTNLVENARVKSEQYWPNDNSQLTFNDVTVTHINTVTKPSWTIRTLELEKNGETRVLHHYHFRSWGDHGVPSTPDPMLFFVRTFQEMQTSIAGPVVVHCSAGVGRSGTFVTLDILLRSLDQGEQFLDVYGTVANMRESRCYMVQTEDQYIFIHQVLLKAIQNPNQHPSSSMMKRNNRPDDDDLRIDNEMFE
ncbi:tyrosine-protein phosphatase 10D-like [Acanthaster planci]|uniref:protein-tyrosine-phosphatase n=1 Tax=Acanthaster planci TaxID=133434 RepID=A0A8B7ZB44_ACAPL|nr:tyrosine-protein phosphatase 10D-like [Acanthaster planci]